MKQFYFSALLLLVVLITGSCKKIPVINNTNSSISFKVDGVSKEAKGDKNAFSAYLKGEKMMMIIGNLDAIGDQQIALTINNFHGVGEYAADEESNLEDFMAMYTTSELELSYYSTKGTIKITEYTEGKSIKGEFQFKGSAAIFEVGSTNPTDDIKVFSDGKFTTKIIDAPVITP